VRGEVFIGRTLKGRTLDGTIHDLIYRPPRMYGTPISGIGAADSR
jgi:hypothetical protein